uniref:DUF6598 domain-containing protein n=1 Tax=Oryza glumipatula TaxID=40148 RepID=A0A0D9Z1W7_9ORYZ
MWRGPIRLLFLFLAATPPLSSSELRRPRQLYDALSIAIHITIPNPNLAGVRGNSCAIPLVAAAAGVPAPLHSSVGASSSQPLVALSHQRRTCGSLASAAPAVARTHRRLLQVGAAARTESTGVPIGFYTPLFEVMVVSEYVRKRYVRCCLLDRILWLVCHGKLAETIGSSLGQFDLLNGAKKGYIPERIVRLYHMVRSFILLTDDKDYRIKKGKNLRPVPESVEKALCETLLSNRKQLTQGLRLLTRSKLQAESEELLTYCQLAEIETIVVWHVATCKLEQQSPHEPVESYQVATALSKYCAYLVFYNPKLLPVGNTSVRHTCKTLVRHDSSCDRSCGGDDCMIRKGEALAAALLKGRELNKSSKEPGMWTELAEFWSELLISLAPFGSVGAHEKGLGDGGEFITHLWALLYHAGIDAKYSWSSASTAGGESGGRADVYPFQNGMDTVSHAMNWSLRLSAAKMADSSKQVGMDTDGGGAAAAAVDGQNLPVLVTNRKRELTLEGKALPVDCSGRRRIDLEKDLSMIGSPFTKHTSDKNGDNNEMRDVDERCTMDVDNTEMRDVVHERDARDVELGDMAAAKELEQGHMASVKEESELIKVVEVLHMVRCREITEYNLKLGRYQNLGVGHRSNRSIARNIHGWCTLNISSIKVTESDVGYPISVFGTVLARDEYDFRRDRDDPQLITSLVRVDGDVDKVFCKGVREHHADACLIRPVTLWLRSCLSTVILVYSPVESAIEACVAVNIQGVVSNFNGKVTAWTTEYHENKIVLYDSKVAGTKTVLGVDGSVELTRRFVAVELEDILVLNICVFEGEDEVEFELYLGQNDEECTLQQGPYKLQVKISWTAAMKKRWRERSMKLGRKFVLV